MMTKVSVHLVRRTICPCGYPILDDSINLGTEYTIYPETIMGGFTYGCGQCHREFRDQTVVLADQLIHPELPPAPLLLALFDYKPV